MHDHWVGAASLVTMGSCNSPSAKLIDEQAARPRFATSLIRILTRFPADRVDDALANAQAAFLALSSDALLSDAQSRGDASWTEAAGRGLARLSAWRGSHS